LHNPGCPEMSFVHNAPTCTLLENNRSIFWKLHWEITFEYYRRKGVKASLGNEVNVRMGVHRTTTPANFGCPSKSVFGHSDYQVFWALVPEIRLSFHFSKATCNRFLNHASIRRIHISGRQLKWLCNNNFYRNYFPWPPRNLSTRDEKKVCHVCVCLYLNYLVWPLGSNFWLCHLVSSTFGMKVTMC
jgi:hypothetical protein